MHFLSYNKLTQLIQSVDPILQQYVYNIPELFGINFCQVFGFENNFCQEKALL